MVSTWAVSRTWGGKPQGHTGTHQPLRDHVLYPVLVIALSVSLSLNQMKLELVSLVRFVPHIPLLSQIHTSSIIFNSRIAKHTAPDPGLRSQTTGRSGAAESETAKRCFPISRPPV